MPKLALIVASLLFVTGCGQNPASTSPDLRPDSQKETSTTVSTSDKSTETLRQPAGTNNPTGTNTPVPK